MIYLTAKDESQAISIAEVLVSRKMVACANILPGALSVYEWKGRLFREKECVMVLKTRVSLVKAVEKHIRQMHSYECPCFVVYAISSGSRDYLKWLGKATQSKKRGSKRN